MPRLVGSANLPFACLCHDHSTVALWLYSDHSLLLLLLLLLLLSLPLLSHDNQTISSRPLSHTDSSTRTLIPARIHTYSSKMSTFGGPGGNLNFSKPTPYVSA